MSSKTKISTSTKKEIYAVWKCESCGEINVSKGPFTITRSETTYSISPWKQAEIEDELRAKLQEEWPDDLYKYITAPDKQLNRLVPLKPCCSKCNKKPNWTNKPLVSGLASLCILPAIIFLIGGFSGIPSMLLLALPFVAIIIAALVLNAKYQDKMANYPEEYKPVIGSTDEEFLAYVDSIGAKLPTPEENIDKVVNYKPEAIV